MIRIGVELDSAFGPHRDKTLGTVEIINDGTGTRTRGNYDVRFIDARGRCFKKKRVENWPRLSKSIWALLKEVMG